MEQGSCQFTLDTVKRSQSVSVAVRGAPEPLINTNVLQSLTLS